MTSNISLPSNSFNKKNILPSSTLAPTSQNHNVNSLLLTIVVESNVDKTFQDDETQFKSTKNFATTQLPKKKILTTIHGNILQVCNNDYYGHRNQSKFVSCLSYRHTWMDLRNGYYFRPKREKKSSKSIALRCVKKKSLI